jgi:hypothetical protein
MDFDVQGDQGFPRVTFSVYGYTDVLHRKLNLTDVAAVATFIDDVRCWLRRPHRFARVFTEDDYGSSGASERVLAYIAQERKRAETMTV